ncbi:MAG: hypothetical protein WCD21_40800, partial [Streptomyces sp.]
MNTSTAPWPRPVGSAGPPTPPSSPTEAPMLSADSLTPSRTTPVALTLRLCLHALLAGLLALAAVRALADGGPRGGAVVGAV